MAKYHLQLSGRLGNQLFQWSFAHNLAIKKGTSIGLFWDEYHQTNKSVSELSQFMECEHVHSSGRKNRFGLQLKTVDFLNTRNAHSARILSNFLGWNRSMDANDVPLSFSKAWKFSGFYQDYHQVLEVNKVIDDELITILDRNFPSKKIIIPADFQFIHIRRGDLVNLSNTYGLLGLDWYQENLDDSLPIVASTDDLKESYEVLSRIRPDYLLKPEEFSALETLSVMSRSKKLVMGNSTLSWWGGYSATIRGGVSIFPNPFYLTNPEGSEKLKAPLFTSRPAVFTSE